MKRFLYTVLILFISSVSAYALEEMSASEMKDATAQIASVAGDLSGALDPVSGLSDTFGPALSPVVPVVNLYQLASPHVSPVLQMNDTRETAEPVTRIMRTTGDITFLGGLF